MLNYLTDPLALLLEAAQECFPEADAMIMMSNTVKDGAINYPIDGGRPIIEIDSSCPLEELPNLLAESICTLVTGKTNGPSWEKAMDQLNSKYNEKIGTLDKQAAYVAKSKQTPTPATSSQSIDPEDLTATEIVVIVPMLDEHAELDNYPGCECYAEEDDNFDPVDRDQIELWNELMTKLGYQLEDPPEEESWNEADADCVRLVYHRKL